LELLELQKERAEISRSYSQEEVRNLATLERFSQEGKEIDLVPLHLQMWGLGRLSSSDLEHIGLTLIPALIILSQSFQICRSIV